jgi:myo-inositol 2-dehydrogenase/D-chiro-inositol 1-dehydrogenase
MLTIGLIGTGSIGRAHIERINNRLAGARVTACSDVNVDFGRKIAKQYGLDFFETGEDLICAPEIDAVMITTSDAYHEQFAIAGLEAEKWVFCEKPMAPTAESCRHIADTEMKVGRHLLQVGFMRRYDAGFRQLKKAIAEETYGLPLLLHCAHRNASEVEPWDNSSAVCNSMVHEIDVIRWLLGEDYATAEVRYTRDSRRTKKGLHDPQCMILTMKSGVRVDVEHFAFDGHCYDIKCEVVCEDGIMNLPKPGSIEVFSNAFRGNAIDVDWTTRFETAYDTELQAWINGCRGGYVDGPTAWDGYACQIAAAAATRARETQTVVPVVYDETPEFYKR